MSAIQSGLTDSYPLGGGTCSIQHFNAITLIMDYRPVEFVQFCVTDFRNV